MTPTETQAGLTIEQIDALIAELEERLLEPEGEYGPNWELPHDDVKICIVALKALRAPQQAEDGETAEICRQLRAVNPDGQKAAAFIERLTADKAKLEEKLSAYTARADY